MPDPHTCSSNSLDSGSQRPDGTNATGHAVVAANRISKQGNYLQLTQLKQQN